MQVPIQCFCVIYTVEQFMYNLKLSGLMELGTVVFRNCTARCQFEIELFYSKASFIMFRYFDSLFFFPPRPIQILLFFATKQRYCVL